MQKLKKAIIPAAGLGTRFLPITKAIPKPMLAVFDKPTIQYIAEELLSVGTLKHEFLHYSSYTVFFIGKRDIIG